MKFTTIGTSKITELFIEATQMVDGMEYYGAYSRNLERAKSFGLRFGATAFYDDLQEMAKDPAVDGVYIASPNVYHCQQAVLMMEYGKHVICEKPVASTYEEANRMITYSKKQGVVFLEAMKPIFTPAFQVLEEQLNSIGRIRQVDFQFCQYSSRYDNYKKGIIENAFKKELSNGAVMDIGVYCIHPTIYLFGAPKSISAKGILLPNGVDGAGTITLEYSDMIANLTYSKITSGQLESQIQGEDGTLLIDYISKMKRITKIEKNGLATNLITDELENSMKYEAEFFKQVVENRENIQKYHYATQETMKVLDEVRKQIGLHW